MFGFLRRLRLETLDDFYDIFVFLFLFQGNGAPLVYLCYIKRWITDAKDKQGVHHSLGKEKEIRKCHESHQVSLIIAFAKSQTQCCQPRVFKY